MATQPRILSVSDELIRVVAPHFVAGIILRDGIAVETAPILKWAMGKSRSELCDYFAKKGWEAFSK